MTEQLSFLKQTEPDIDVVDGSFGLAQLYEYSESWKPTTSQGLAVVVRYRGDPWPVLCLFSRDQGRKLWDIKIKDQEIQNNEGRLVLLGRENDTPLLMSLLCDSEMQAVKCRDTINRLRATATAQLQRQPQPVQVAALPGLANAGPPPPPVATPGSKPPGSVVVLGSKDQSKAPDAPPPPPPIATSGSRPAGSVVMTPVGGATKSRAGSEQRRQSSAPPPIPTPTSATVGPNSGFPTSPNGIGVDSVFNVSNSTTGVQPPPAAVSSPPPKSYPTYASHPPQQQHQQPQQQQQQQQQQQRHQPLPQQTNGGDIFSHRALSRGVTVDPPTFEPSTGGWRCGPDINELRLAVVKVAMSDSTSVNTLKAMMDAYQNH